jgi:hypothetical protein
MKSTQSATPPARAPAARRPARGKAAPAPEPSPVSSEPREERVRRVAYSLYLQRGHVYGSALADWLQAEALVDQEDAAAGTK